MNPEDAPWYASHSTLVSVASWAVEHHALLTPDAVVRFFEKPWQYDDLYADYLEENPAQ